MEEGALSTVDRQTICRVDLGSTTAAVARRATKTGTGTGTETGGRGDGGHRATWQLQLVSPATASLLHAVG